MINAVTFLLKHYKWHLSVILGGMLSEHLLFMLTKHYAVLPVYWHSLDHYDLPYFLYGVSLIFFTPFLIVFSAVKKHYPHLSENKKSVGWKIGMATNGIISTVSAFAALVLAPMTSPQPSSTQITVLVITLFVSTFLSILIGGVAGFLGYYLAENIGR